VTLPPFRTLTILGILFSSLAVEAGPLGVGAMIGEPTGLSAKLWMGPTTALQLGAAWSFRREPSFQVHLDYLFHNLAVFKTPIAAVAFYVGIGGRFSLLEEDRFGVRFPLGLAYAFPRVPVDLFLELVPILELLPASEFHAGAALGVRYYF